MNTNSGHLAFISELKGPIVTFAEDFFDITGYAMFLVRNGLS